MTDLSPFAPITLAGGILANLATDLLKHHAQALEGTLAGRLLKRLGLLEPSFQDRLRDALPNRWVSILRLTPSTNSVAS